MTRGLTVRMTVRKSTHSSHRSKRREASTGLAGADETGEARVMYWILDKETNQVYMTGSLIAAQRKMDELRDYLQKWYKWKEARQYVNCHGVHLLPYI